MPPPYQGYGMKRKYLLLQFLLWYLSDQTPWKNIATTNKEEKEMKAQTFLLLAASSACLTKAVPSAVTCCITEKWKKILKALKKRKEDVPRIRAL